MARRPPGGMSVPGPGRPTPLGMPAASLPDCRSCKSRCFVAGGKVVPRPWGVSWLVVLLCPSYLSSSLSSSFVALCCCVVVLAIDVKPSTTYELHCLRTRSLDLPTRIVSLLSLSSSLVILAEITDMPLSSSSSSSSLRCRVDRDFPRQNFSSLMICINGTWFRISPARSSSMENTFSAIELPWTLWMSWIIGSMNLVALDMALLEKKN